MSRRAWPLLLLVALASCAKEPQTGACVLGPIAKCIETTADEAVIANQNMACTEAGGTWSSDPCPTASLIGCCAFTQGSVSFRECFYTGSPDTDPAGDCTTMRAGGVWTPAP